MGKTDNMLAILWLLRSRGRMSAPQLAEALETSVRTIYRYIDALCASGVPIVAETGPEGGYELTESFRGAPLFFTPDELVALFQAALFAQQAGYHRSEALDRSLAKVRYGLSPAQEGLLERHAAALAVAPLARGGPVDPWLSLLEAAAAGGQTVELLYQKPEAGAPERRVVDPYAVAYRAGYWYMVAFCHARQALRDFRVDRVRGASLTGATFQRPPDFDIDAHMGDVDWVNERVSAGPRVPVRIEGRPNVIDALCEHWYLRHFVWERAERLVVFHIDPVGIKHLPSFLFTFGEEIRILEPADLREAVAEVALGVALHHRQKDEHP